MFETNPANYVDLAPWAPQKSYVLNNLVFFENKIYKATSAVPVNQTSPNLDVARWAYQADFIMGEVAITDTFRKMRVNFNAMNLAAKTLADAAENAQNMIFRGVFTANTIYKAGHTVVAGPWGNVYTAKVDFTSGGTFSSANWDLVLDLTAITPISEIKTASFTAEQGKRYFINSLGGNVVVTLPASPTINTRPVWLTHIDGNVLLAGQNVTLARNGSLIMGFAEDLQVDKNFASFSVAFSDAAHGYRVTIL